MIFDLQEYKGVKEVGSCQLSLDFIEKYNIKITVKSGTLTGEKYSGSNYFEALNFMRADLEKEKILLGCNGVLKNFHPSSMSLEMADGLVGYSLKLGRKARRIDLVNTFEMNGRIQDLSTLNEQKKYYETWKLSL